MKPKFVLSGIVGATLAALIGVVVLFFVMLAKLDERWTEISTVIAQRSQLLQGSSIHLGSARLHFQQYRYRGGSDADSFTVEMDMLDYLLDAYGAVPDLSGEERRLLGKAREFAELYRQDMHKIMALRAAGADRTTLEFAIQAENDKMLALLTRKLADINNRRAETASEDIDRQFRYSRIALLLAAACAAGGMLLAWTMSVRAIERYDRERSQAFDSLQQEIGERRRAEEELRRYKDQLEDTVRLRTAELMQALDAAKAASKAKSAFLATMSHELRTPLNAILGFSRIMRNAPQLDQSHAESLDIINRSGEHLLTLINDVLEIAKIESGRLQLDIAPFDLYATVREVIDMMRQRAEEKGLRLVLDQGSDVPRYVRGDEIRLRQILVNLVSNAVKFTEQGQVAVRLQARRDARYHLQIEVEDSGPGIGPADRTRIFKPFVQLAEGGEQEGTGLGLAIVNQFVQLMGGSITVESAPGEGALFRVDVPVEPVEQADLPVPSPAEPGTVIGIAPGHPAYRILIAEDQRENQLLLMHLMQDIGLETKIAENGEQCVQLFLAWRPHLIWMDRRMPVMDGEEAARRIRRLAGGDEVKIVAVTASAFKEEHKEMLDAGIDDFVAKPYRFNEIYACLARQLGLEYVRRADAPKPRSDVAPNPTRLGEVPAGLRHDLRAALEILDAERIAALLLEIDNINPELGGALRSLAKGFDYQGILGALDAFEAAQG